MSTDNTEGGAPSPPEEEVKTSGEEIRIMGIALAGAVTIAFAQGVYGLVDLIVGVILLLIVHTVNPLTLRNWYERFMVWPAVWGFCFLVAFGVILDRILTALGYWTGQSDPDTFHGFPVFEIAMVLVWIVASVLAAIGVAIFRKQQAAKRSQQAQKVQPSVQTTNEVENSDKSQT